jgi:hypothetical protein
MFRAVARLQADSPSPILVNPSELLTCWFDVRTEPVVTLTDRFSSSGLDNRGLSERPETTVTESGAELMASLQAVRPALRCPLAGYPGAPRGSATSPYKRDGEQFLSAIRAISPRHARRPRRRRDAVPGVRRALAVGPEQPPRSRPSFASTPTRISGPASSA